MPSEVMDCFTAFAMTSLFMERSVSDVAIHAFMGHGLACHARNDSRGLTHPAKGAEEANFFGS
jgi:hypothetical protein